jgi:hypothetical protein
MGSRTCPQCGLISPLSASRCDCGHNFATGVGGAAPSCLTPTVVGVVVGGLIGGGVVGVLRSPYSWSSGEAIAANIGVFIGAAVPAAALGCLIGAAWPRRRSRSR